MKRSLIFFISTLLCSSVTMAGPLHNDQQGTDRQIRAERPSFLGVELGEVNRETVTRLKLREERGALIEGVTSGSSAAQAGLQKNDVILKWDGEPIESAREMSRHIRETPPGRVVRLTVMRDGREMEIAVTLGERSTIASTRPRIVRPTFARPAIASLRVRPDVQVSRLRNRSPLGVELQGMTPQLAEYFGLSKRSGALVIFVFADSPAAKAGFKAGDVILSAGGETVENPLDVRRVLSGKTEGTIEFKVLRDKQERTLTIQLEKGGSSWLLIPDEPWDLIHAEIAPIDVQVPMIAVNPTIRMPAVGLKPMTIHVPAVSLEPMTIQVPNVQVTPMAIPSVKLTPMKVEIPQIHIEPMKIEPLKLDQIKIEPIKIEPLNIVVVPRRIVL